jgi:predicted transcriptional regulator
MVKKRERLEVIHDILIAIRDSNNKLGPTRLLYQSNLSPQMFREYIDELLEKGFILSVQTPEEKKIYSLTKKGFLFLEQYQKIVSFIENFGL